jgi:drug/metabolite transporter (DMT)-like permease
VRRLLPIVAAAAVGVQVGAAIVVSRFVIDQTAPASLALLRYAIGFMCLVPPLLLAARVRFAPRDLLPIAALGIVQFGVLVALLNFGLREVPAGRAAVLFATMPLLTLVFAAALGRERLTLPKLAGVLLTLCGVALAVADKLVTGSRGGEWPGALAILASAACGAACSVLYRPYLLRYPTLPVSALAMFASIGFLALLAAGEGFFAQWPAFTAAGWAAVAFIGVSSGAGYWLWLWALRHVSPTRVTVFLSLSPVTAALLGAWWLAEPLRGLLLAALVCVVAGIRLAFHAAEAADRGSRARAGGGR